MQPPIHLNWLAIVTAVLSHILIGFLWYGPIYGNAWMKETGLAADFKGLGNMPASEQVHGDNGEPWMRTFSDR